MKELIITFLFIGAFVQTKADKLIVGEGQKFTTIKAAISKAQSYDTVLVKGGLYKEHTIIVDKPLFVLGNGSPTIDAENQKVELFIVASDSVTIQGFVLKNVGVSYLNELSAIKVKKGRYGTISNNEISGCFFGIYLEYSESFTIVNNTIKGTADDEASAGNAIHVWKGKRIKIIDNIATGHRDGIYFEFVDDSYIKGNKSFNNLRYGLHFMFSNRDEYIENEFRENGAGVAVMFSKDISMKKNVFSHNWGGASYGLLLKEISDGQIIGNEFERNTTAILAEGANRITITGNQFTLNGKALDIKGNCLDNKIVKNNFLSNTFEVVTNSRYNNNEYDNNYWSSYQGYDLDHDGIGDEPYRPVNLFAKITNEIPAATIMLHSFFVSVLDLGERIFPEVIPEELIDKNPKMRPFSL